MSNHSWGLKNAIYVSIEIRYTILYALMVLFEWFLQSLKNIKVIGMTFEKKV